MAGAREETRVPAFLVPRGMSRKEFLRLGGAGMAGTVLLGASGCGVFEGGSQDGTGVSNPRNITFNLEDTIRDLYSTTTTDSVSTDILLNVMSGLYRLDADTRPVPDLAKDVEISEDQLTYTFTLRDGIKWSNGDPVTAQDFEYAWLKVLNPATGAQYAYIISTFVKGTNAYNTGKGSADDVAVKATDDKTLEVELVAASPFWLGLTAFYTYLPLNKKFVEEQGEDYALSSDALLFNGPYKLTSFKPTEGITMVKNEGYWNKANVPIEKVEGEIVKQLDTAVNLYKSGELDVQTIDGEYVDEYKDSPEYHTLTFFATFYMVGNQKLALFRNPNVRKAIQIGYDRNALVNQILKNGSASAPGFVPFGIAGPGKETFREAVGPTQPEFDPDEARSLFQNKLISGAREELDETKRMDMLEEAEKILVTEDAGCAPIFFQGQARLQKPYITRYVNQPYGGGRDISLWRVSNT